MVMSSKIRVSAGGIHGYCWFAASDIKKGELIWWEGDVAYNDIYVKKDELISWSEEKRAKWLSLAYMIDADTWRGSDPARIEEIPQDELNEYFVNHSCHGNVWYNGETEIEAMRDIKEGEEITYDYALTECDPDWILAPQCLCGTSLCRGKVTGNDWKSAELQDRYQNHFTTHIMKLIEKQKAIEEKISN